MSLKKASLGFFKYNGIQHYTNKELIIFPCLHCSRDASMIANTSYWECCCGGKGNLRDLKEVTESRRGQLPKVKSFINPRKEKAEIRYIIQKIINGKKDDEVSIELQKVLNKFNRLWEYKFDGEHDK